MKSAIKRTGLLLVILLCGMIFRASTGFCVFQLYLGNDPVYDRDAFFDEIGTPAVMDFSEYVGSYATPYSLPAFDDPNNRGFTGEVSTFFSDIVIDATGLIIDPLSSNLDMDQDLLGIGFDYAGGAEFIYEIFEINDEIDDPSGGGTEAPNQGFIGFVFNTGYYFDFISIVPNENSALKISNLFVADTYAPTSEVPLPAALWLLASGLGGLAAVRRRFKRQES